MIGNDSSPCLLARRKPLSEQRRRNTRPYVTPSLLLPKVLIQLCSEYALSSALGSLAIAPDNVLIARASPVMATAATSSRAEDRLRVSPELRRRAERSGRQSATLSRRKEDLSQALRLYETATGSVGIGERKSLSRLVVSRSRVVDGPARPQCSVDLGLRFVFLWACPLSPISSCRIWEIRALSDIDCGLPSAHSIFLE